MEVKKWLLDLLSITACFLLVKTSLMALHKPVLKEVMALVWAPVSISFRANSVFNSME